MTANDSPAEGNAQILNFAAYGIINAAFARSLRGVGSVKEESGKVESTMKILNRQAEQILKAAMGVTVKWGGRVSLPATPKETGSRLEITWRKGANPASGKLA